MREIEPMERDGPTKKIPHLKVSNQEEQLDKDLVLTLLEDLNSNPTTFLEVSNSNSNSQSRLRALQCPTLRPNYWNSSEQNWLAEVLGDYLDYRGNSKLLMMTDQRTWTCTNSRRLVETSE